ncbi:MAG: FlgD immunoglobulin-like domain containing protein [Candidatus Cloacimonetes bacterium]|nr:FlgD immunoglobulin-like domain containing protein [Candidatus Cloacimonadota bacterium]
MYPNPFRIGGTATMDVSVKAGEKAEVQIYNSRGQVLRTMNLSEGFHHLNWDGTDNKGTSCSSGTYFYRISSPSINQTRKLMLIK